MSGSALPTLFMSLEAVGGLGGISGLVALLRLRADRKQSVLDATKTAVDVAQDLQSMTLALLTPIKAAADDGETRAAGLQTQIGELDQAVVELSRSLAALAAASAADRAALADRDSQIAALHAELAAYRQSG